MSSEITSAALLVRSLRVMDLASARA